MIKSEFSYHEKLGMKAKALFKSVALELSPSLALSIIQNPLTGGRVLESLLASLILYSLYPSIVALCLLYISLLILPRIRGPALLISFFWSAFWPIVLTTLVVHPFCIYEGLSLISTYLVSSFAFLFSFCMLFAARVWPFLAAGFSVLLKKYQEQARHESTNARDHGFNPPPLPEPEETFDPYFELGVSRDASKDDVRRAYKDKIKKYHPDNFSHLGEDFREMANRRATLLNKAYEMLYA